MKRTGEQILEVSIADVTTAKVRFREQISENIRSYEKRRPGSVEEVLDTVSDQHAAIFGRPRSVLIKEKENLERSIERKRGEISRQNGYLEKNLIPAFIQNCWHFPVGYWERMAVITMALVAFVLVLIDVWVGSGLLVRSIQSRTLAFLSLSPIVGLPLMQAVALRLAFEDKGRKRFIVGQSIAAAVIGIVALWLTMGHSEINIASIFAGQVPTDLVTDKIRLCCQLTFSFLMAGVLVEACIDKGTRNPVENPKYSERITAIEGVETDIDVCKRELGKIEGILQEIEAERNAAVAHCWRQAQKVQKEFDRYWAAIEMLAKENFAAALVLLLSLCAAPSSKAAENAKTISPIRVAIVLSPNVTNRASTLATLISKSIHYPDSSFQYFDGLSGVQIAEYKVPNLRYPNESASVARIAEPIQRLVRWTTNAASVGHGGELEIPKVLGRLAQACPKPNRLLVLGSPIYRTPDLTFDFASPKWRFPGLGLLTNSTSPFTPTGSDTSSIAGCKVFFAMTPPLQTERYEKNLQRFWASFFKARRADLVAFIDPESCLKIFDADQFVTLDGLESTPRNLEARMIGDDEPSFSIPSPPVRTNRFVATNTNSEPMKTNPVRATALSRALPVQTNSQPAVQAMKASENLGTNQLRESVVVSRREIPEIKNGVYVVLRYQSDTASADLFFRPNRGVEISHKRDTSEGEYHYEYDNTSREHVAWARADWMDPTRSTLYLNYGRGVGRCSGRVLYFNSNGQRGELPFSFEPVKGADATATWESTRRKSLNWIRVNLIELCTQVNASLSAERPQSQNPATASGQAPITVNHSR